MKRKRLDRNAMLLLCRPDILTLACQRAQLSAHKQAKQNEFVYLATSIYLYLYLIYRKCQWIFTQLS